jgi:PAS domain S-box-containing protein
MSVLIEEFCRFAELFPEPILLVSTKGHLCAVNSAARGTLLLDAPLRPEQLIFEFVADTQEKVTDYLRACGRSAQPLPGLLTFLVGEAAAEPFHSQGSAFRSRDSQQRPLVVLRLAPKKGATSRFVALNYQIEQLKTEIARRVNAERQLQEQRELLQVTLSSIGDAVIATDVQGRITFMNPVAELHTGYDQRDCLGEPLEKVFVIRNEQTGAPAESPVHKVLRTGGVVGLANHTVLVQRNGAQLPIDDSAAPIRDDVGKLFGVILVFREVSESRKLQHELLRQTEALREADRRKDEFLAVLAHELRNPLAPLRNGLEIARLQLPSEQKLGRTVIMMERQLLHLVRLVDDLMDVNRVSRGVIELRRAPVSIRDVLARSVEAVRLDMEARGHDFRINPCAEHLTVDGDAQRLVQVFSNLLTNSAKYSQDGGLVELSAILAGAEVVIRVRDHGIGIPTDQLERVFEMFSQVRIHQGRAEGGLGIGLSLVRTLVNKHGGSVSAHSEGPGAGSTFTVRLPVSSRSRQFAPASSEPRRAPASRSLRIVVADDNADAAQSLCLLLEELGSHEVRTASTGREAIGLTQKFAPALIFMDVGMPNLDGIEATRLIREGPGGQQIVIVALTGWGQPRDREQTRLAGVDRHVVKPISPEDLAEILTFASRK